MTIGPEDMSPAPGSIADHARVVVLTADFANIDASGKLNVIGAGAQIIGRVPVGPGVLALPQMYLVAVIEVVPAHHHERFSVSMSLVSDETGPVMIPQPDGQLQAVRVQQLAETTMVNVPAGVNTSTLAGRTQLVLGVPPGLPVQPGETYRWVVEVDGHVKGSTMFQVPREPAPPVVG